MVHTPQQYNAAVEKAFDGTDNKWKCEVEDVYVVADYKSFFKPCIDSKFGRWTKEEWTQLQVKCEAVILSDLFPNGVATSYKKFSSDRVVGIEKRPKAECKTRLGLLTGKKCMVGSTSSSLF